MAAPSRPAPSVAALAPPLGDPPPEPALPPEPPEPPLPPEPPPEGPPVPGSNGVRAPARAPAPAGRRVDHQRAARHGRAPVVVRGPHADAHHRGIGEAAGHERRGATVGLVAAVAVEVPLVAHDGPVVGRRAGIEGHGLAGHHRVRRGHEGRRRRRGGDDVQRGGRRARGPVAIGHAQLDGVAAGRGEEDAGLRAGVVVEVVVAVGLPLVARDGPAVGVVGAGSVERRGGLLLDVCGQADDRVGEPADDEVERSGADDAVGVADADPDRALAALRRSSRCASRRRRGSRCRRRGPTHSA